MGSPLRPSGMDRSCSSPLRARDDSSSNLPARVPPEAELEPVNPREGPRHGLAAWIRALPRGDAQLALRTWKESRLRTEEPLLFGSRLAQPSIRQWSRFRR